MVTWPGASVVTSPVPDTVARFGSLLVHSSVRSVTVVPVESSTVAVSCTVPPCTTTFELGDSCTVFTGTLVTCMVSVSTAPSALIAIFAVPNANAVTRPVEFTVAMVGVALVQFTTRPAGMEPPTESVSTDENCRGMPRRSEPLVGVMRAVTMRASTTSMVD